LEQNDDVKTFGMSYACSMDVNKMLSELREEREHIDEVILSLERLARGQGKRRGRPPAWLKSAAGNEGSAPAPKKRGRPPGAKNKPKEEAPQ